MHAARPPTARRPLGPRLALATGTLLLTLGLLELVVRVLLPAPLPVQLRDGIYVNLLPLVGDAREPPRVVGAPLPRERRPGEVRVFVFGESSVQGAPWDHPGSPPTMLHDQLRTLLPGRDVTVVNMGRGGAVTRDTWYHVLSVRDLGPDYVVFYQGVNDSFSFADAELCAPLQHPRLFGAWRWLVGHSRLVWTARTLGRHHLARALDGGVPRQEPEPRCDEAKAFAAWTDVLVGTARDLGARVYVTTPVESPLRAAEDDGDFNVDRALRLETRPAPYRALLVCLLLGCPVAPLWQSLTHEAVHTAWSPQLPAWLDPGVLRRPWVHVRGAAWRAAARRHGAQVVDFDGYLQKNLAGGLRGGVFQEDVHLTLQGAWLLSWLWLRGLGPDLDPRLAGLPEEPAPLDQGRYERAISVNAETAKACTLLRVANTFLRLDMPLVAAPILLDAAAADGGGGGRLARTRAGLQAQLLLGAMRQRLGLTPGVPAVLAERAQKQSIADQQRALTAALQERRDCSTVGGALLADLAPATVPQAQGEPGQAGTSLEPVAQLLAALPADVSQTGVAPADALEARLRGEAAGVRLFVARRPDDGQAHGGTLLPSLLVLTDPRSPAPETRPAVDAVLAQLRAHDHGQYRWERQPQSGQGGAGRKDPGGPPTPGLLPLTWALLLLGVLALPLALRDAGKSLWPQGLRGPGAWTLAALGAALAVRLVAPHRLVMVHFGWLLVDQSAELGDLPRYGPAPPLLYHALFQVFGADAAVVQHAHVVLGTLGLLPLVALAARALPDPRTAPVVAWLLALLPLSVLDHGSESILVPALTWWAAAVVLLDGNLLATRPDRLRLGAAGVLLALCGLSRPDTLLLALPALALWLLLRHGRAVLAQWQSLALLALVVVLLWLPDVRFLAERTREDVAQGNLPRLEPDFVLQLPRMLVEQWVVLEPRYFPWPVAALALAGLALPGARRAVLGWLVLALVWAVPMLLDFNETSMLRLHAPSAQLVTVAAGLALVALCQRWGAKAAGPVALGLAAGLAWTAPHVFALQNSDHEEQLFRKVAAHARDGRPATYVTRGFDDPPDKGIHLVQPRHLLEPHDRWLAVHHFERDPQAALARGPVYFVRSVRCYAHDRRGTDAPAASWVHPACADFCARWTCRPLQQASVPNRGERGFAWYPYPDRLPSLDVGLWAVEAPGGGERR